MQRNTSSTHVEKPVKREIEHTLRQLRTKKMTEELNTENNGVNNNGDNDINNNQPVVGGDPLNPAWALCDFCMPIVNETLTTTTIKRFVGGSFCRQ